MADPTPAVVARWAARGRAERASAGVMDGLAARIEVLLGDHEVVAALRSAGEDERRHERLCDEVVARLGGAPVVDDDEDPSLPPPFLADPRAAAIEHVVFLLCAGEAIAADLLAAIAARVTAPGVAALLGAIAADEARHGELGWRVLDALLPDLDPALRPALLDAVPKQAMRAVIAAERVRAEPDDDATVAWGVPSSAATAELARRVVAGRIAPALHRRGLWPAPRR